jgi:3'-phosphoadenosine 5'-phosphosulfate sulfotransferase (PAPS reductase)/FAD synthetase
MRTADELIDSAHAVLRRASLIAGNWRFRALFSGGHDSLCATHLVSQHERFGGRVEHVNTGTGAEYTRLFVQRVCDKYGWHLTVRESPDTYEQQVIEHGFPGPAQHSTTYNRLKDRCFDMIAHGTRSVDPCIFISGARAQESSRRMGYVEPIIREPRRPNRIWCAPCHDWSKAEQQLYMDEFGLPINKFKIAVGVSGECGCGCYAEPGEFEKWREHAPEMAAKMDRLAVICKASGKHCEWGGPRTPGKAMLVAPTGPGCQRCDRRALELGIVEIHPVAQIQAQSKQAEREVRG